MKFRGEENELIWESFRGKIINERFDEDDDLGMMSDDSDFGDDGFDGGSFDDDFDDNLDDGFDGPETQGMVMEIDPIAPVETHEVNEVLVSELKKLAEYAKRLYGMKDSADFEDWMVSAITIASTYVSDVWHRLDAKADFANTGFKQSDDFKQF
jgi:hypothetical protein